MLYKLLRKNISIFQWVGYVLSALTGMTVLLIAFSFSTDIRPLFSSKESLFKPQYIIANKKVSLLSTLNSDHTVFSANEIEEIKKQPFVRSLTFFTPCQYKVKAYIESEQIPYFASDLFFEAVPDHLLDNVDKKWQWKVGDNTIPIVIPRDYLSLYNFGFAGSQGLPQISESIIQQVTFRVIIYGNGKQEVFHGYIAGFSDYLNTILVPISFMEWANKNFSHQQETQKISRLIIETANSADPQITTFFANKPNYDLSNKGEGNLSYFLKITITVVMLFGLLILLPSIGLLGLSINLLIHKNQKTLKNLILQGFQKRDLVKPYLLWIFILNILVVGLSIFIALYARQLYLPKLAALGITSTSDFLFTTLLFGVMIVICLTLFNGLQIYRQMRRLPFVG